MSSRLYPTTRGKHAVLPEGSGPLLVVGVVTSSLTALPAQLANKLVDLPAFGSAGGSAQAPAGSSPAAEATTTNEAELLLHVDHEHGVAYLVLSSPAGKLSRAPALLAASSEAAAHAWLADRASERALAILFHLCQVILFESSARCADVRLLRTLRVLATVKQNVQPAVAMALKPLASQLPPHRPSAPPVLPPLPTLGFLFTPAVAPPTSKASASKLQQALEAQVRRLLSSSKQLARSAAGGPSALFTLPKEPNACVHVDVPTAPPLAPLPAQRAADAPDLEHFGRLVGMLAAPPPGAATSSAAASSSSAAKSAAVTITAASAEGGLRSWLQMLQLGDGQTPAPPAASAASATSSAAAGGTFTPAASAASATALRRFVVRLAEAGTCHVAPSGRLAAGSDKAGRAAPPLPSASQWSLACRQLLERVFASNIPDEGADERRPKLPPPHALTKLLDAETAVSLARGQAALPAALEIYSRALPPQYSRSVHEHRVAAAEGHVRLLVIGPAREATLARLRRECLGVWQAGRQMCDAVSLTGRPCCFRAHMLPHEAAEPPEGLAAASGLLCVGDQLLAVNGTAVRGHARATTALKRAVGSLKLSILRKSGAIEVELFKPRLASKLGIVLSSTSADTGTPAITGLGTPQIGGATSDVRSARPHSSSFSSVRACHCGRTLQTRDDPFSFEDANSFFDAPCCATLSYLPVPMRQLRLVKSDVKAQNGAAAQGGEPPPAAAAAPEVQVEPCGEATRHVSMARLSLLGPAESYRPARGLQHDGFVPRANLLTAAALRGPASPANAPSAESPHKKAEQKNGATAQKKGAAAGNGFKNAWASIAAAALPEMGAQTDEVGVGCEFECASGHRFLGALQHVAGAEGAEMPPLEALVAKPLPLCRKCAAEGCTHLAQLQRLYVRSPASERRLVLEPHIRFEAAEDEAKQNGAPESAPAKGGGSGKPNGKPAAAAAAAAASKPGGGVHSRVAPVTPILLPRDSLTCLCLPYVYAAPEAHQGPALLTRAVAGDAATPQQGELQPHWLTCSAAGAKLAAEAAWIEPEEEGEEEEPE